MSLLCKLVHAQNEFGGANLRTRIFLCRIAGLGRQPDQARVSSEFQPPEQIPRTRPQSKSAPSRKKCALPEKTGLSARCRVIGICLSRYAPSHPASAPSPSAFLHAAHFLCRIAGLGMRPDSARISSEFQPPEQITCNQLQSNQPPVAKKSALLRTAPLKLRDCA